MFAFFRDLFQKEEITPTTEAEPKDTKSATQEALSDIGEGLLGATQAEVDAQKKAEESETKKESTTTQEEPTEKESVAQENEALADAMQNNPDCRATLSQSAQNITNEHQEIDRSKTFDSGGRG